MREQAMAAAATAAAGDEESQFTARLREQVAQAEANAAMEVGMAERQVEGLRKEVAGLRAKLGAALGALASVSASPSAPTAWQVRPDVVMYYRGFIRAYG
jgi:hypothetical protein